MIEAVILSSGLILGLLVIVLLIFSTEGSKGITQQYKTKSGKTHTAKKSRVDHIV